MFPKSQNKKNYPDHQLQKDFSCLMLLSWASMNVRNFCDMSASIVLMVKRWISKSYSTNKNMQFIWSVWFFFFKYQIFQILQGACKLLTTTVCNWSMRSFHLHLQLASDLLSAEVHVKSPVQHEALAWTEAVSLGSPCRNSPAICRAHLSL